MKCYLCLRNGPLGIWRPRRESTVCKHRLPAGFQRHEAVAAQSHYPIAMLELVLKLVEKLTELVKLRQDAKARQFTDGVASVYREMEAIHSNYLTIFESALFELRKGTGFGAVAESLVTARVEHEALRRTMRAIVEVIHADGPKLMTLTAHSSKRHSITSAEPNIPCRRILQTLPTSSCV